jgi:hypothetical protein
LPAQGTADRRNGPQTRRAGDRLYYASRSSIRMLASLQGATRYVPRVRQAGISRLAAGGCGGEGRVIRRLIRYHVRS